MRAILENALNRTWYGPGEPGVLLRGLSRVYAKLSEARRQSGMAHQPADLASRPIVVVGNITAGGTGKTPVVIRLCDILSEQGIKVGVVSRGYGRRSRSLIEVEENTPIEDCGDEPWLVRHATGVPVVVSAHRVDAARRLLERGVEIVISDDGLQHWPLPSTYEICIIDTQRGLGNGRLLPAGPLREPPERLQRVNAVFLNGDDGFQYADVEPLRMTLALDAPRHVKGDQSIALEALIQRAQTQDCIAATGIGNPKRFFSLLEKHRLSFKSRVFPDHHSFTSKDFAGLEDALLIMTEKDAIKCRDLDLTDAWYLPIRAQLPADWENAFAEQMLQSVNEDKSRHDTSR